MLIEFSVSNFRSFRDRQTFSMVASGRLKKKDALLRVDLDGDELPDLLKVAAIYGPNATGKSNLIKALAVASKMCRLTPNSESRALPVSPFRFDRSLADSPSRFEYNFIHLKRRYKFEFALTATRVWEEALTEYPRGVENLLYHRIHTQEGDVYKFGSTLEGESELHKVWKNLTGPQVFFLTQAVANSNESLQQLRTPLTWIQKGFGVLEHDLSRWAIASQTVGANVPAFGEMMASYLLEVDVPVTKIVFENNFTAKNINSDDFVSEVSEDLKVALTKNGSTKTTLTHKTALGEADFDFFEESEGTRNLMGFFLPWSVIKDQVIIVDELDSSLHPRIVAALVKKHLTAAGTGQLIFTTHDTHLMDTKLLRRDQFWLTERDANGATQLRSIHDFAGREGEDIEKRYYEGRYRSLPILPLD